VLVLMVVVVVAASAYLDLLLALSLGLCGSQRCPLTTEISLVQFHLVGVKPLSAQITSNLSKYTHAKVPKNVKLLSSQFIAFSELIN